MSAAVHEVVLAGNICLDIIPPFEGRAGGVKSLLAPGNNVHVGAAAITTGGSVANTGLALLRLGARVRLIARLGDDLFGRAVLEMLHGCDADLTDDMIIIPGAATSYTIVISPPGEDRVFIHHPGANDLFEADDVTDAGFSGARVFHFGYPPSLKKMYADGGAACAAMFGRAKKLGLTTSLDMAKPDPETDAGDVDWPGLLARALPFVDVFIPSLEEILYVFEPGIYEKMERDHGRAGIPAHADTALVSGIADRIIEMGAAAAAVKLGDRGLYVKTTDAAARMEQMGACAPASPDSWISRELYAPCFRVDVAGTTGAGDVTAAGFIAGLLNGMDIEGAMLAALGAGACCVEKPDAVSGVARLDETMKRIEDGWPSAAAAAGFVGWKRGARPHVLRGPSDGGM